MHPVELKFCVDVDFLEYSVVLGFIEGVSSYDDLTDYHIRILLEACALESKSVVTLEKPDKIIKEELYTNMKSKEDKESMPYLFVNYYKI